jgi:uncharacterized membrane protein
MARYKYLGNKNPVDSTNQIILDKSALPPEKGGVWVLGEIAELTYTQYLQLRDLFVLEEVKEQKTSHTDTTKVVKYDEKTVAKATDQP